VTGCVRHTVWFLFPDGVALMLTTRTLILMFVENKHKIHFL